MEHKPVLLEETISSLNIKSDGIYVDLTIGRGGHSSKILEKLTSGRLIGFDQDITAINESEVNLNKINDKFELHHTNFVNFKKVMDELNIPYVDGVLMDLGVSSPQFDDYSRGFSYREDAPLDMRMNQDDSLTAYQIVNTYSLDEIKKILSEYGDEKYAYSIAKSIVCQREKAPIKTTLELVDIIKRSKPMKELKKEGHPAKQTFQALRIAVNDELNVLKEALYDILPRLKPHGGRLSVITFHSGEDKIVKSIFKEFSVIEGDRFDGPSMNDKKDYQLVNHKVITASKEELDVNPRSKSAKLRIIERK